MFTDEYEHEDEDVLELKDVLFDLGHTILWLYFDYMLNEENGTFERFKEFYTKIVLVKLMDGIHDKYADHVEGLCREIDRGTI